MIAWQITPWKPTTHQEEPTQQPETYHHIRGRPEQTKAEMGNAKETTIPCQNGNMAEYAMWQTIYRKQARGEAAHVAIHKRENQKKRPQKEQHALENNADVNTDDKRLQL